MSAETVPVPTARRLAYVHDMLPPGIAQQVQAEHDVAIAALEVLLAESRQDADRAVETANRWAAQLEVLNAELVAARRVVDASRELVSTDQTPALDRATTEVRAQTSTGFLPAVVARAAVSAALHDPDDPDWLARVEHDYGCLDCKVGFDGHVPPVQDAYRHRANTVRAAILGEA